MTEEIKNKKLKDLKTIEEGIFYILNNKTDKQ